MILDALLGGLVGSILTVVAREVLEIFRDSKQHKYSLQRHYFEKKLQVAEAASSAWFKSARSYAGLQALYDLLAAQKNESTNEEIFYAIHDNFTKELDTILEETDDIANSIFLYFDFDGEEFFDTEPLSKLIKSLSKIEALNRKLNMLFEVERKLDNPEESLFKDISETQNEIRDEIGHYGNILKETKEMSLKLLTRTRKEIRKHEP